MKHGSLFSGIGGFDLAAEWIGWENSFNIEIDPFCQRLLKFRFPNAKQFRDIREFDGKKYSGAIDIISGGFPCQNISLAASKNRIGINGEKSGLWIEQHRIVNEIKPKFVVIENSATINKKGLGRLLGAYSDIGYDAEWYRFEPKQFGLPQKRRQRTYIILYTACIGNWLQEKQILTRWDKPEYSTWRNSEDRIYGVVNGIPNRVDRHRALGNAVVPRVARHIFSCIENSVQRISDSITE